MAVSMGITAYSVDIPKCRHDCIAVLQVITLKQVEIPVQCVFIVVYLVMLHAHCGILGSS